MSPMAPDVAFTREHMEELAQLEFAHFNPRAPTDAADLGPITAHQRIMESLEQRHAQEQFAKGRAVRHCPGPGLPVYKCVTMKDLEAVQMIARTHGWK